MLGPPEVRALDQPVLVSLESLVPPDHFYRHLDSALDAALMNAERRPALGIHGHRDRSAAVGIAMCPFTDGSLRALLGERGYRIQELVSQYMRRLAPGLASSAPETDSVV